MANEEADIKLATMTFDKVYDAILKETSECNKNESISNDTNLDLKVDTDATLLPLLSIFNVYLDSTTSLASLAPISKWLRTAFTKISHLNQNGSDIGLATMLLSQGQTYTDILESNSSKLMNKIKKADPDTPNLENLQLKAQALLKEAVSLLKGVLEREGWESSDVRIKCNLSEALINYGNCLEVCGNEGEVAYREAIDIFKRIKLDDMESGVPKDFMEMIEAFENEIN